MPAGWGVTVYARPLPEKAYANRPCMTPLSLLVMLLGTGHGLEVVVVNVEGGLQALKLCLQVEALGPLLGCRSVLIHHLLLGLLRVKGR